MSDDLCDICRKPVQWPSHYGDWNCPHCNQAYAYDEGFDIRLTDAQLELLRNGAAASRETVCPHVRGTVTQHCSLNFTLTDEEREAVEWCIFQQATPQRIAVTIRKLLERLK